MFLTYCPDIISTDPKSLFRVNWNMLLTSVVALYYVALDTSMGLFAATLLFLGYVSSTQLVQRETFAKKGSSKAPFGFAWKLALALHVLSWFMQIKIGHIEFEGRRPALLDSFFQSLVLAPLFVVTEGVWMLGFNLDLKNQVQPLIDQKIASF